MELDELKKTWTQLDEKLDKQITLNKSVLTAWKLDKTRSRLHALSIYRLTELLIFTLIVVGLGGFIANHIDSPQFYIPAAILDVFAIIGLSGSIGQLVLISQIDYAEPLTTIQKKIIKLETHMMQNFRLILFSVPFYTAYIVLGFKLFFDVDLYLQGDRHWWIAQIVFSIILLLGVIWLGRKISRKHMHTSWIKKLIYDGMGGKQIASAMAFLNQIEDFEKE